MQGLSQLVADRKAQIGDFVNNITGEIMGVAGKTQIKLLPFSVKKMVKVEKWNGSKYVFDHIIHDSKENPVDDNLPYEFTIGADKYRNMFTYGIFFLTETADIPLLVTFSGKAKMEGKKLFNYMQMQARKKPMQPPFGNWIRLDAKNVKNDQGNFMVPVIEYDRLSTEEEREQCRYWKPIVSTAKINDVDDGPSESAPAQPAANVSF